MSVSSDIRETIVQDILEAMQGGVLPWRRMWKEGQMRLPLRHNGQGYQGINILILLCVAMKRGFQSPYWMTFHQASELGAKVKKGAKSSPVVFYKQRSIERENEAGETETGTIPMLKSYRVFNAEDIEGLPAAYYPVSLKPNTIDAIESAEAFIASQKVRCVVGVNPLYNVQHDSIEMPERSMFETSGSYYVTHIHEIVHATGHSARLARPSLLASRSNIAAYAEEELVAELGAMMACAVLGIEGEHVSNHAAYVSGWMKRISDDPKCLFSAAHKAQAAVDYLMAQYRQSFLMAA